MIGENWDEANIEAVKSAEEEGTFLVHPFDQVREVMPLCQTTGKWGFHTVILRHFYSHNVPLSHSHCYTITLLLCYNVTLLHYHTVTLFKYHTVAIVSKPCNQAIT